MTVTLYPNGLGGVLGDELATATELYTSGNVYYVHHSGDNTNAGTRQQPFATWVHALTVIDHTDIVVLLDGHTETVGAPQTISKNGVKVCAEGSSSGIPTVSLTSNLTDQSMLTISGINVTLGNIRFPVGGSNSTVARIHVSGTRSMIRGCYMELGADDAWGGVQWTDAARGARMYDSTIIVMSMTTAPGSGLITQGMLDAELEAVTFDGGTVGFGGAGFLDLSALSANPEPERLRCQQMRLLNGARFLTGPDTTGYIGISEKSGSASVQGFARRLPHGFGQTGDPLLTDTELYMSGVPIYVHYGTGNDSNSGEDELNPKKTLISAEGVTGPMDIIVCLPNHDEPVMSSIQIGSGVTIVGCGTSGGNPSCKIHWNGEGPDNLLEQQSSCYVRNMWIQESTEVGVTQTGQVAASGDYAEMRGCVISCGYRDHLALTVAANLYTLRETKVESTGTGSTTRASRGLFLTGESDVLDMDVRGTTFSNGQGGFTTSAMHVDTNAERMYMISGTLLFGADVLVDTMTGIVNVETSSGSSSVLWS